jgi:MinD-like ATPase involved in chromosome partitioning or flagellar assembly
MVLWVTSSDFSSINNSVVGLETLQQLSYPDSRIRLMLNIISPDDSVRAGKIEEVLGRKFFWSIPYDRQVRLDGQVGRPAVLSHPDCRGARSITELAQALMGTGTAVKPAGTKQAPLRRLFRRGGETSAPATEGS